MGAGLVYVNSQIHVLALQKKNVKFIGVNHPSLPFNVSGNIEKPLCRSLVCDIVTFPLLASWCMGWEFFTITNLF